ncbi:MAG: hypothetical protein K2Y37_06725 [Pirellulales bacterium]|nr:hypothetical protein [Pirellulales bacterium]
MSFSPRGNLVRWLSFRNDSAETIPPCAVMRITGAVELEGQAVLTVDKPDADGGTHYVFNGALAVAAGEFGSCTHSFPCCALFNPADAPAVGQAWGAQSGSWALKKGNRGYRIVAGPLADRVEIVRDEGSLLLWAKAIATWTRVAGPNASYVDCYRALEKDGTLELDADDNPIEVRVWLPSDDAGKVHPNVRADQTIAYLIDPTGVPFSVDPKVADDPIDTVKMWTGNVATLRGGWRELSAMRGRFPVGVGPGDAYYDPSTLGAADGTSHHTHADHVFTPTGSVEATASGTATISGGGISGSGTIGTSSETTGVTVADHDPHYHSLTFNTVTADTGTGVTAIYPLTADTTTEKAAGSATTLTHDVTDPGHAHDIGAADVAAALALSGTVDLEGIEVSASLALDEVTLAHDDRGHIPPFSAIYFIERFE